MFNQLPLAICQPKLTYGLLKFFNMFSNIYQYDKLKKKGCHVKEGAGVERMRHRIKTDRNRDREGGIRIVGNYVLIIHHEFIIISPKQYIDEN